MTEQEHARRNLNPHKPAIIAMTLYGHEYSQQKGGSMDFWDCLSEIRKQTCREILERINAAPNEETP